MGVENKYKRMLNAIESDPDYVPTLSSSSESANILRASGTLNEAKMDLAKLRQSYNDSSAFVQRQLKYVNIARGEFLKAREDFIKNLKISYDEVRAEEMSLKEALDRFNSELVEYPELGRRIERLDMQIHSLKSLLESLEMKRGEVRLKAQSDQRISSIVPLNSPSIKFGVSGGKKFLYLVFASILAVVLGLVVALMVDVQDHRIYDRRQAERMLDINVLGAVSNENRLGNRL